MYVIIIKFNIFNIIYNYHYVLKIDYCYLLPIMYYYYYYFIVIIDSVFLCSPGGPMNF